MADPAPPYKGSFGPDPRLTREDRSAYLGDGPVTAWQRLQALQSLDDQMKRAGWSDPAQRSAEAVIAMRSAQPHSLQRVSLTKDSYVYAFATRPTEAQSAAWQTPFGKRNESLFYMTEAEYEKALIACRTEDGRLDRDQIKNRFALPCDNQCDQVVRRPVTQDHEVWRSTCGGMSELFRAFDGQGRPVVGERYMAGGGEQVFCTHDRLGERQEHGHGLELTPYRNARADLASQASTRQTENLEVNRETDRER